MLFYPRGMRKGAGDVIGKKNKKGVALHHLFGDCAVGVPAERAKSNVAVRSRPKADSYIA